MMDKDMIKELRKSLKEYVDSCVASRKLAEKLGFEKVVAKIQHDIDTAEEHVQVEIARSRFEDAKRIESTDPKRAKEIAKEAVEILQEPPTGISEKEQLIKEIQKLVMGGSPGTTQIPGTGAVQGTPGRGTGEGGRGSGDSTTPRTETVEEDVKRRLEAADKHAEAGNFSEALQICKDAIQVALDTHDHDMEELAKEKAKDIEWRQKFGDLDKSLEEFLDKDIFLSKGRVDEAIRLVTVDGSTKDEIRRLSHEAEEEIHKTMIHAHDLIMAAGDTDKKDVVKGKIITRIEELNHDTYEKATHGSPADVKHRIFVDMKLPDRDNEDEMHLYFRLKLDSVLNQMKRAIADM